MNELNDESDLYKYLFPNGRKCTASNHQDIFSEYGCMEAINIEYNKSEDNFVFSARKEKSVFSNDDNFQTRVMVPSHDVLPFGKPNRIKRVITSPTSHDVCVSRHGKGVVVDVQNQMFNLSVDHPDAYHGTFLKLFSQYFPYNKKGAGFKLSSDSMDECGSKGCTKFLGNQLASKYFYPNLSPTLCDIPSNLLNDLLLDELTSLLKKSHYNSDYCGGCLTFQSLQNENSESESGFLVYPQGGAMDQLRMQLISCQSVQPSDLNPLNVEVTFGSSYKMHLNGRIVQTCSALKDDSFTFGARTHYNIMMASINKQGIEINEKPNISSEDHINILGALECESPTSSLSINPYIQGEGLVGLHDGSLYIWDSTLQSQSSTKVKSRSLRQVLLPEVFDEPWMQAAFACHPRQIYVARRNAVSLVDVRVKSVSHSKLLVTPPCTTFANEKIMTILPGNLFQGKQGLCEEYQCIVATQANLMLMDQRYCKNPLLQWSLSLKSPCQFLSNISVKEEDDSVALLVAANQLPQEIHSFQYKTRSHSASHERKIHPPTSQALPRSLGSFKSLRRASEYFALQGHEDLKDRLSMPIIGLTGFSFGCRGNERIVLFHMTECGDIIHQPLHLLDKFEEETCLPNVVTGLQEYSNHRSKIKQKQNEVVEKLQRDWAEKVTAMHLKNRRESNNNYIKLGKEPIFSFKSYSTSTRKKCLKNIKKNNSTRCLLCNDECLKHFVPEIETVLSSSDSDDDIKSFEGKPQLCPECFVTSQQSDGILHCHNSQIPITSLNIADRPLMFDDDVTQADIKPLDLIKTHESEGLGKVLVSTWDGDYEDVWEDLENQRKEQEIEEHRKQSLASFDLHATDASVHIPNIETPGPSDAEENNIEPVQSTKHFGTNMNKKTSENLTSLSQYGSTANTKLTPLPSTPKRLKQTQVVRSPKTPKKRKLMIGF